jgi:hypothetical protein
LPTTNTPGVLCVCWVACAMCPIESARVFITNANAYGDQSISWRVGLGKDNQMR